MRKQKLKENKGITLIAMVITIIVLLILAGVSIAMLTGENGILTQAQRAKNETENAAKQEEMDLAQLEATVMGKDVPIIQVDDENPGQLEQENDTTFVINSIEDLVFFSYDVTNGNTYEGKTVKLGTNLDFSSDKSYVDPNRENYYGYSEKLKEALTSGTGFSPIGNQERTNSFYGIFDGDNKTICSLYINMNSDENLVAGLFTENYGEIKNIGLVDTNITVQGEVNTIVGGVVGVNFNNIYNSYVTGSLDITAKGYMPVGGICGGTKGSANIEDCYNLASIECKNINETQYDANITCGGIAGQTTAENSDDNEVVNIEKCFNRGNINVDGGNTQVLVGGIIGSCTTSSITSTIRNCYNNETIQGSTSSNVTRGVGGIAGNWKAGNLSNCYNVGDVIGTKNGNTAQGNIFGIGGIIGRQSSNSTVENVFNIGKVTSTNSSTDLRVGGITGGGGIANATNVSINNSYNTGLIEANGLSNEQVGSIAGSNLITFSNCYYLKETYSIGVAGSETSTGVTKWDSIEDFPSVLSVVNVEGAFKEDINNINNGYPILYYQ